MEPIAGIGKIEFPPFWLIALGCAAQVMIPMAIPSFGGMLVALISLFIVPVLYSWWEERKLVSNENLNAEQHDTQI